ncbi:MAG: hypothetical protein VKJ06_05945 [Vampirovibrionales bacterium]|nr:hypothetical protein [Vampirovibrionales bacterium]
MSLGVPPFVINLKHRATPRRQPINQNRVELTKTSTPIKTLNPFKLLKSSLKKIFMGYGPYEGLIHNPDGSVDGFLPSGEKKRVADWDAYPKLDNNQFLIVRRQRPNLRETGKQTGYEQPKLTPLGLSFPKNEFSNALIALKNEIDPND